MGFFPSPHHFDHFRVGLFGQVATANGDVVHQLIERGTLVLLHLEVGQRVHEVKERTALLQLLDKQLWLLLSRHICRRERQREKYRESKRNQDGEIQKGTVLLSLLSMQINDKIYHFCFVFLNRSFFFLLLLCLNQ